MMNKRNSAKEYTVSVVNIARQQVSMTNSIYSKRDLDSWEYMSGMEWQVTLLILQAEVGNYKRKQEKTLSTRNRSRKKEK